MAGRNMLEALSFEVLVIGHETADFIGSIIQQVERVLVKPEWSALKQVSIKVSIEGWRVTGVVVAKLFEALQSLFF